MVVLVNNGTSSGAEVVSVAWRDGRSAQLVGQKTLGKWSVQRLDDLPNGHAMKYTISLMKSGRGLSFDGAGVIPDVEVTMDEKDAERSPFIDDVQMRVAADTQLRVAVAFLRGKLGPENGNPGPH